MPSINLIWEQREQRRKSQRLAMMLLAVIGVGILFMAEEVVRTQLKARQCLAGIKACEQTIADNRERADQNKQLETQIEVIEPTVGLLQEAQRITLRWVNLLAEIDACVPDPDKLVFSGYSFAEGQPGSDSSEANKNVVGTLGLSGSARNHVLVCQAIRRLNTQRHISDVRLINAMFVKRSNAVNFSLQARVRIPEDEEKLMAAAAEAGPGGRDYSAVLENAGKGTILNREAPTEKSAH